MASAAGRGPPCPASPASACRSGAVEDVRAPVKSAPTEATDPGRRAAGTMGAEALGSSSMRLPRGVHGGPSRSAVTDHAGPVGQRRHVAPLLGTHQNSGPRRHLPAGRGEGAVHA